VSLSAFEDYAGRFPTSVLGGTVFGVTVWLFGGVVAMPLWLSSIGLDAPTVPNVVPMSLLAHTVYGAVLGVAYPVSLKLLSDE
jgi:Mg/Co/Ni transporter MgtE